MKKVTRKYIFLGSLVMGIITLLAFTFSDVEDLRINKSSVITSVQGLSTSDLTYEKLVKELTSNILIGRVVDKDLLNDTKEVYKVRVDEHVIGETNSNEILIYTGSANVLEIGEQYLFYLTEFSSPMYDKDFYVQHLEFILKINENGSVERLIDEYSKEYEPPFVDEKYNELSNLVLVTKQKFSKVKQKNMAKTNISLSDKNMVSNADHIVEIKVLSVEEINNGIAQVTYNLIEKHKNGNIDNSYPLLIPERLVEKGKEYLVFLTKNSTEGYKLLTKENSVILKGSSEYWEIVKDINKIN